MSLLSYERPREKIAHMGVASLSLAELLQVLIGSGGAGVSSARIAKELSLLLCSTQVPSLQQLVSIDGVGHAKACSILAAIELGQRLSHA